MRLIQSICTTVIGVLTPRNGQIIVIATAQILAVYPFIQKYFVAGVMLGSIKG